MNRDLRVFAIAALVIVLAAAGQLLAGCAAKAGHWQGYNIANKEFTALAEQYDQYYGLQAPEKQAKWKAKFDPIFDKGDRALSTWRKVLDAGGDPAMQVDAFNAIKADVINVLFELSADGKK